MAGLAEGMALADRAGLQQKDVLEVLELTGLACPILLNKGKSIIDGGFPTHQPLQHMQKDLKLSLNMGDTLEQPLPLTASANEVSQTGGDVTHSRHTVYIRMNCSKSLKKSFTDYNSKVKPRHQQCKVTLPDISSKMSQFD